MPEKIWDTVVVGAGAAGLMTAIQCRRGGLEVLLLDTKPKIGAKILMSGGTRCNITNAKVLPADFETETPLTLRNILKTFPADKARQFFEEIGLELVLEEGGKYFPSTHSGRTVLEAFLLECDRLGIQLETPRKVTAVRPHPNPLPEGEGKSLFLLEGEGFSYQSKTVVLCTGGLSYPSTGSDGTGYKIAETFGHTLVPLTPSLTPLETDDPQWKSLAGVSLEARLTLRVDGKKKAEFTGGFLFTHTGFSGPAVLNVSRYWLRETGGRELQICFLPQATEDRVREELIAEAKNIPTLSVRRIFAEDLPERLLDVLFEKSGVDGNVQLAHLQRIGREKLIRNLFYYPLAVTKAVGYGKAEVTAGGVDLSQVDPRTLESRLRPGLFFAGEILDVDGRIGGFNFQWAWSSGAAAARAILARAGKKP